MRFCCSGATNDLRGINRFVWLLFAAGWVLAAAARAHPNADTEFDIPGQNLTDALDRFSEQSGLQVVYDQAQMQGKRAGRVVGAMPPSRALDRLLQESGLSWEYVNPQSVVIQLPQASAQTRHSAEPARGESVSLRRESVTRLGLIEVREDPRRILPNEPSDSAFGFAKPLLETPRSVSFISEEAIDLFGLSAMEDLVRVVPGVFTTTRFGIQGAVDVRSVPADTFIRGMKRLSLQGHGRSVVAAMDTIEVVGGPPSPLYGMGKIGGYSNMIPKSGRAQSGTYLTETQGFAQLIGGNYQRREGSFGIGGPLSLFDRFGRHGGYYVYGLVEDSDSFAAGVPVKQLVLQAATSIDEFIGPFRVETGANYQVSRTAGALTGRFTQDLVDSGRYIRGTPLIDLDANGNGAIGYLEMQRGSPVQGALSTDNQPLMQSWNWPVDAAGRPLPLDKFPVVPGIPRAMYDYLVAHPEADPTGLLRAQGVGGPVPQSGAVPIGMALDPRTVGYDTLDLHRAAAFEKDLQAKFLTLFVDLIYDTDPDFTLKNQLFFDGMDQYKNSNQPFVQEQNVYVVEDKLTLTWRIEGLPSWARINSLFSLNWRNTVSKGRSAGNDFSSHRTDAMAPTWTDANGGMTPNSTFQSPIDNPDLLNDGYPWGTIYRTEFSEIGFGMLFDVDLWSRVNLLVGGRRDGSRARNVDFAESFNPVTGTAEQPGAYFGSDSAAQAWDAGTSWSTSLSYSGWRDVRPYATWATASIVLDGNNNALSNTVINAGHIGSAELKEIGVKASLFDGRMLLALAAYEQARTEVDADDPSSIVSAYATATNTRGWTAELKWVPNRKSSLSAYALNQVTRFDPNVGSVQLVDARTLGFQDVLDAQGNVIFPAEAFLYGGRSRIVLPAGLDQYEKKQGNPQTQLGLSASYRLDNGIGVALSGNHFSSTCTGRLCTVRLPASSVANAAVFYAVGAWTLKLDVANLFNERYFRARTGDTLGNVLAQALPDRRWQVSLRTTF